MFHRHKSPQDLPIVFPRPKTVRLLQSSQELQAAIERAREYERRGADEYQRRIGAYDRFLHLSDDPAAKVVFIDSQANASD